MKSTRQVLALLLSLAMLLSLTAVLPAFAEAEAVIEIGEGTNYPNIRAFIDSGADYAGKTFRLVSDITEGKPTLTKSCTIDGNGHTVISGAASNTCYIFNGEGTAAAENNLQFEIRNARFVSTFTGANFTCLYVRKHAGVTLTDCTTDASVNRVVGLQNKGDCHLTVNSGCYWANTVFLKHDFTAEASDTLQNTVVINGGFFGLTGTAAVAATDLMTCLFNTAGFLRLTVNGGVFYSPVTAPLAYQKYVGASAPAPEIKLESGTFYLPEGQTLLCGRENKDKSYTPAAFTVSESAVLLRTLTKTERIPEKIDVSSSAVDITPAGIAFSDAADAGITLGGQTFAGLADGSLDGVADRLELTADSTAAAAFEKTPVRKNGYQAAGITGTAVRQNFGEQAFVQYRTNSDGTYDARIILAFTEADPAAAVLTLTNPENGNSETVSLSVCYRAFLANGSTVTAEECGGTRVLIVSVSGLTDAQNGKTLHIRAGLSSDSGVHTSRSFAVTLSRPAA